MFTFQMPRPDITGSATASRATVCSGTRGAGASLLCRKNRPLLPLQEMAVEGAPLAPCVAVEYEDFSCLNEVLADENGPTEKVAQPGKRAVIALNWPERAPGMMWLTC